MQRFAIALIGILFLGVGVFMYVRNDNLTKNCTVEAEATVVDMKQELNTDSDGSQYMYSPIVEYKVGEETLRVTMDTSSSTPPYSIGTKLTILYNPNKTKQFIVKGDNSGNIMGYVFLGIGAALTCYGIVVAFKKD